MDRSNHRKRGSMGNISATDSGTGGAASNGRNSPAIPPTASYLPNAPVNRPSASSSSLNTSMSNMSSYAAPPSNIPIATGSSRLPQQQQQQPLQKSPYLQHRSNFQPFDPSLQLTPTGRSPIQGSMSPSTTAIPFNPSTALPTSFIPGSAAVGALPNSKAYVTRNMASATPGVGVSPLERSSYHFSENPLFACDWATVNNNSLDCIALGSYKEGFINKLEIVYGKGFEYEYAPPVVDVYGNQFQGYRDDIDGSDDGGFILEKVADTSLNYPVTHVKWDPTLLQGGGGNIHPFQRLAASSDVLRLYKVTDSGDAGYNLVQTHVLANNATSTGSSAVAADGKDKINTSPPVTSFDWNSTDTNILITSSVDTTCTVWDLNRSHPHDDFAESATIKTQLIAHDSEVFDVKFIHKSTNVFASVGNDGSMRVFDLRSLEHSTIIYEPPPSPTPPTRRHASLGSASAPSSGQLPTPAHSANYNAKALLRLSTSNIDQHHLATFGVNSSQIIIIDMRMPGLPMATIDASSSSPISSSVNSIQWHPTSNYLLSGGDDCQALVWDLNNLGATGSNYSSSTSLANGTGGGGTNGHTNESGSSAASVKNSGGNGSIIDVPVLAYDEDLEVNSVCWRQNSGDYMGVVSGKGFQAVSI
ncbi:hypothetical protein CORT_0A06420 [Candida orthopsilosis Co 90-125]|uniref:WD40 repeat-like protein n=1 Tax=Candida orthopsilosis (strain 90-125) TaxID=1136231 RepID=H8WWN9_CANO9|nr:hypothetical protein CORT_0A06420 [Candida orthopsilosis Co 90-125]CCG21028.1 hypothetical protein CORT_0A06420 [Candida orthopsilosis Co 90-125]